jgi:hypothetical protein
VTVRPKSNRHARESGCQNASVASKSLTDRWRNAAAAEPSDWRLMGVVCGPREVDPAIRSADEWCAWARGPNKERLEGRGPSPHDALVTLTVQLERLEA